MVLKPEDIEQSDFTTSRRGYDKDEVRAFLQQVAGDVRGLQEQGAQGLSPSSEAAAYLPQSDSSDLGGEDRFGALGDRIATLLREAHDASEQTRETANNEATDIRTTAATELEEARAESERIRQEAADYRVQVDEEAIQIRNQAEIDGNARLDERRALIEEQEVEIAAERETAMAELSDARSQVASLLQEARAQSEFIKREAEEIIRAKVRANMDKAQRRIDILRTTEESSKDRILTAQRELESALTRLEAEPLPEFPADTEDAVVLEAEGRVAEAELVAAQEAEVAAAEAVEPDVAETAIIEAEAVEADVIEASVVESDSVESDSVETESEANGADQNQPFTSAFNTGDAETDQSQEWGYEPVAETEEPAPPTSPWDLGTATAASSDGMFDLGSASSAPTADSDAPAESIGQESIGQDSFEQHGSAEFETVEEADVEASTADVSMFDSPQAPQQPMSEPVDSSDLDQDTELVGASVTAGDPSPEDATDNEDALARLVREAMQRAVDSARGDS